MRKPRSSKLFLRGPAVSCTALLFFLAGVHPWVSGAQDGKNTDRAVTYRVDQGKLIVTDTDSFHPPAPWVNPIEGKRVEVPEGVAVVEHSIFCGKDCGITIYVNRQGGQIAGYLA